MGYGIDILNTIRNNASEDYKNNIPEATQQNIIAVGNALATYELAFNEFSQALMHKIGKTILESKLFKNKLARFKSGAIVTQQDVEEIFVEMADGAEGAYDPEGPNPLGRRATKQDKVYYHRMNRRDYYVITLGDLDFPRVFRSEATFESFVAEKLNSVYSRIAYDEWLYMKNVLATYDGYFDYVVPALDGSNNETACKQFVKTLRKAATDVSFMTKDYNKAGVMTQSDPKAMTLFIHKDLLAELDVEVLAKAYNMGKTDIQLSIEVLDDFGTLEDTYALLVDNSWFRIYDTLQRMEPQRNAQGLFTNYFFHVHQILSASPFKNAVRFTTKEAA